MSLKQVSTFAGQSLRRKENLGYGATAALPCKRPKYWRNSRRAATSIVLTLAFFPDKSRSRSPRFDQRCESKRPWPCLSLHHGRRQLLDRSTALSRCGTREIPTHSCQSEKHE